MAKNKKTIFASLNGETIKVWCVELDKFIHADGSERTNRRRYSAHFVSGFYSTDDVDMIRRLREHSGNIDNDIQTSGKIFREVVPLPATLTKNRKFLNKRARELGVEVDEYWSDSELLDKLEEAETAQGVKRVVLEGEKATKRGRKKESEKIGE